LLTIALRHYTFTKKSYEPSKFKISLSKGMINSELHVSIKNNKSKHMKISIILIALLLLNTSALLAETIGKLLTNINTWVLVLIEVLLIVSYFVNSFIRGIHKVSKIDMNNLNLFVVKNKRSA